MDQNKLNELKELARKATPGPYKCEDMIALSSSCSEAEKYYNVYTYENEQIAEFDDAINKEANAKYFAAVNPQVVLALISEIGNLEKELDEARCSAACESGRVVRLEREADWLAERLSQVCRDCGDMCYRGDLPMCPLTQRKGGCRNAAAYEWREAAAQAINNEDDDIEAEQEARER